VPKHISANVTILTSEGVEVYVQTVTYIRTPIQSLLRVLASSTLSLGTDLVDWLHTNVEGFIDRRHARKYAALMLKVGVSASSLHV
jgi:hypothetical protein